MIDIDLAQAEAYWRAELEGVEAPTSLPLDRGSTARVAGARSRDTREGRLSAAETGRLFGVARRYGWGVDSLVEAAWALLLSCSTGEADPVFGTIISSGSPSTSAAGEAVGSTGDLAPARIRVTAQQRLRSWLDRVELGRARRRRFARWPLSQIHAWSDVAPGVPLFESLVVVEVPRGDAIGEVADAWERVVHHGPLDHALALCATPGPELRLTLAYDIGRFDGADVERLLSSLQALLAAIATGADPVLAELDLMSEHERDRVLGEWNRTQAAGAGECVHRQFERQAARTPEAAAVALEGEHLTYRALDQRANQLAHLLRREGAAAGSRIGLCLERSPAMVVALLGILKAGCAYVPFDPRLPEGRLRFLIDDSRVFAVLAEPALRRRLPDAARWLSVDDPRLAEQPRAAPSRPVALDDVAYVIYTSGSTGRPKGVLVSHRGLANFVEHTVDSLRITPTDRVLQFASISFDTAAEEIYAALLTGATLVLRTDAMIGSVNAFLRACRDWGITVMDLPTAYWHVVVEGLAGAGVPFPPSVRAVIIGGERAKPDKLDAWFRALGDYPALINTYGPTEATVACTGCVLRASDGAEVPIGWPMRNLEAYVLDRHGRPVPVGVPGELHISGVGVAHGYLDRPELTAERFIPDPFSPRPGARMYRTGDVVKYRADGSLIFVGRVDMQVKFRGYRIELQEIEAVLARHDRVREAVVLLHDDGDQPHLVAHAVVDEEGAPTVSELRGFLRQRLPAHMVPGAFVFLAALPLTSRGKIDTRALTERWRERGARC